MTEDKRDYLQDAELGWASRRSLVCCVTTAKDKRRREVVGNVDSQTEYVHAFVMYARQV